MISQQEGPGFDSQYDLYVEFVCSPCIWVGFFPIKTCIIDKFSIYVLTKILAKIWRNIKNYVEGQIILCSNAKGQKARR